MILRILKNVIARIEEKSNPNTHRILLYKYHNSIVLDQKNSSTYYYDKKSRLIVEESAIAGQC